MNIIIFGTAGSGKDSVAGIIEAALGHGEQSIFRIKLGAPIRQQVDMLAAEGSDKRALYQKYGETMREIFGEDCWSIRALMEIEERSLDAEELGLPEHAFIIADGRQMHEFRFWQERGFITLGVKALENKRAARLFARDGVDQIDNFSHPTEIAAAECVELCDFIIHNNGEVEDLVKNVTTLLLHLQEMKREE